MKVRKVVREIGEWLKRPWNGVPAAIWLVLALLGVILVIVLVAVQKPWDNPGMEKLLAGKQLKLTECIPLGIWAGSALSLATIVVLAPFLPLLARWSSLPSGTASSQETTIIPGGPGWRAIFTPFRLVGLGLLLALALGLRLPSFPDGIHRDEQDTLRRNTFGYDEERTDGSFKFKKRRFSDVLWENGGANNPVFYSICARVCLEISWKLGIPRDRFTITAVRLPSLIAGLAAIVAIWALLLGLELEGPAWVAGLLAAIHPMHIDYSAEGRGYGFVLLFTVLQMLFLLAALRQGRWRWWAGYGLSQFLLLYSNPGSLYFPFVVNLMVIGLLAWRWWNSRKSENSAPRQAVARGQFWRLMIVNLVSGVIYLQLMAPCIPQIKNYFKITSVRGEMSQIWMTQVASQYSTGLFLFQPEMLDRGSDYLSSYIKNEFALAHPMVVPWIFYVMPIFLGLGLVALWRQGIFPRFLVVCTVIPPVLCWFHHAQFTGLYLYYWYVIFGLPFMIMAWAAGMTLPFKSVASRLGRAVPAKPGEGASQNSVPLIHYAWVAVPIILLPFYFIVTHEGRKQIRTGSGHPYVEIKRGSYTWRVFPEGRMVRYLPTSKHVEREKYESPARAQERMDGP